MNYSKANPKGLDKVISMLQDKLYNDLPFENMSAFGRVYELEKDGEIIPAHFYQNEDYLETLLDDSVDCQFFFVESGETEVVRSLSNTEIDIVFMLNLAKLKPEIQHRADEEIKIDIQTILSKMKIFKLDTIQKGIDVFEDFSFDLRPMQPFAYLKFSGVVSYQYNC